MSQGNGPDDFQESGYGPDFDPGMGADGAEGLQLPPWERRERFGFLNGLYLTIKDVLFTPRQFFHRMPSQVGLLPPLLFAILIGVVGAFFDWMWSLAGSSLEMFLNEDIEDVIRGPIGFFFNFLMSPISVGVAVFVKAGIIHLGLMIFGGNRLGFEATFRVAAYAQAAGILSLVPFCGGVVGVLWGLMILIIGLYSIHETDPWKAVGAVVLPLVLCLGLVGSSLVALLLSLN